MIPLKRKCTSYVSRLLLRSNLRPKMWRIGCIKQIFWANQTIRPSNMWNCVEKHQEQTGTCIVCVHGTEFTIAPKLSMQGFQISSYNHRKKKKIKEIVSCFGVVNETFVPITCTPPIRPMTRFLKICCKQFITLHCSTLLKITNNTTTDEWRHYKIRTHTHNWLLHHWQPQSLTQSLTNTIHLERIRVHEYELSAIFPLYCAVTDHLHMLTMDFRECRIINATIGNICASEV